MKYVYQPGAADQDQRMSTTPELMEALRSLTLMENNPSGVE